MEKYLPLLLLLVCGCQEIEVFEPNKHIEVFNAIDSCEKRIDLSDIADSISYIKLQSDSLTIGAIKEINFVDSLVFISDEFNIYCFDNYGTFIRRILNSFEVSEKRIHISSFTINHKKELIYLLDSRNSKFHIFDFFGNHIFDFSASHFDSQIASINEDYLVSSTMKAHLKGNKNFQLNIINTDLKYVSKKLDFSDYKIPRFSVCGLGNHFYYFNGILSYWDYLSNSIYRIPNENEVRPEYIFDLGPYQPPLEWLCGETDPKKVKETRKMLEKYLVVSNVKESENYLFIYGIYNSRRQHIVYNKAQKSFSRIKIEWSLFDQGFFNDIDGGFPFWPKGSIDESTMYSWIEPYQFAKFKNHYLYYDLFFKNGNITKTNQDFDITSNPWLMIIHLRKKNEV